MNKMAGFPDSVRQYFPIEDIKSVVKLVRAQFTGDGHPDLALLSILLGIIENALTCNRTLGPQNQPTAGVERIFPIIEFSSVEALYVKFVTQIKGSVDTSEYRSGHATRDFVKKVSDVIWSSLSRSYYKDKAHLQSLYSFLTGNKLDCFGVAFAVVAACQVLGYGDVHLALSEDHAWVVFGENGSETAEVTWHGKGNEDKRGQPINLGVAEKSWLYLNGQPVVCTREMEVAAMVSGINPSINTTTDSIELGSLQQELLLLLYDLGHLDKYPMALGNLADLGEIDHEAGRSTPSELFKQAIESAKKFYNNQHVYPYTYFGGHLYRKKCYKLALEMWANAANVIRRYNYNREDEEIYKEFLEIAHELIPNMLKTASMVPLHEQSILRDPQSFAYLLEFYDGICQWEEGSSTPVLHIGWAKHFITCVAKFSPSIRELLDIKTDEEEEDDKDGEGGKEEKENDRNGQKDENDTANGDTKGKIPGKRPGGGRKGGTHEGKSNSKDQVKGEKAETKSENRSGEEESSDSTNPNISALAADCGDVLHPDYLLENLTTAAATPFTSSAWDGKTDFNDFLSSQSNGSAFPGMTMESVMKAESPAEMVLHRQSRGDGQVGVHDEDSNLSMQSSDGGFATPQLPQQHLVTPKITFTSAKMKGLRDLLTTGGKINTSAIQLQLTAQSQVTVMKRRSSASDYDYSSQRRRQRRE
ncbi:menin-like [Ptychodera flava]|uniref:menin-like n=1 Tax=Ptychodera flava TaxID=63121 RepID=UPI00396A5BAA